jgi:VIT1/CCC1 family predicted Fe2+/Mn2+ transporter
LAGILLRAIAFFLGGLPTLLPYVPLPCGISMFSYCVWVSPNCVGAAPSLPISAF